MEVVISSSTDPVMLHFRSCCTGGLDRLRLFSAIVQCDCSSRHRGTLFQHFFRGLRALIFVAIAWRRRVSELRLDGAGKCCSAQRISSS